MTTFTLEDGTGVTDATSYVSEAFSDDYLGSDWAADSASKQEALILASEYVDLRWGNRFKSEPLLTTQGLEFPRKYLYDRYGEQVEGIPDDLKKAVCHYAARSVAGTLYPSPSTTTSNQIKSESTRVGPIATSTTYLNNKSDSSWLSVPLADKFLRQYIYGGGLGAVVRA
jgi:hypothetical protein